MKILMVCTGNICRSPMAEVMLVDALSRCGVDDVEVVSAGTWAGAGQPATREAQQVMRQRGIDLTAHRSQPLTAELLDEADLILAMTSVHAREIAEVSPGAVGRTVLMKELVEMEIEPSDAGAARSARLASILGGGRPEPRRALDLDDPMGLPVGAYERTAEHIEVGVGRLVELLCGEVG